MDFKNDPRIASFEAKISKIEPILLGIMLLGFVEKAQDWGIPDAVFIVSLSLLACLYFFRGVILVHPDFTPMERFINKLIYFSMVSGLISFLFQVMSFPNWEPLAIAALTMFWLVFVFLVLKKLAITKFLTTIELSTIVLILIYFAKVFLT